METTKITVKVVESDDEKSVQEKQAELDAKAASDADGNSTDDDNSDDIPPVPEITQDQVLDYIEKTKGKRPASIDDILLEPTERVVEKEIELDADVAAYNKFKKETGRGIADFYRLNALSDSITDEEALFVDYQNKHKYLSADDIKQKIADDFGYDPEDDSDSLIRARTFAKKEAIAKAREALEIERQKYSAPLESRGLDLPEDEKNAYQEFKQSKEGSETAARQAQEKRQFFTEKTNEFFSDKFEGFKFKVGDDNELVFKVENVDSVKENQLEINNVIKRFVNEEGYLTNIEEYHRSMAMASDPDRFMKFAYEQGMSDALKGLDKDAKNIDMDTRNAQQSMISKGGITVKPADDNNTTKLVIKPRK